MAALFDTLKVVAQIAVRNLFASRWKTLIVGGIIAFGAFLVVVGTSLLDGVDRAMRGSITGSVAGHIQVYSSQSKDELEIMGSFNTGTADIAPLEEFAKVRTAVLEVPNVRAIVPMGVNNALVTSGNTVDRVLEQLRESQNRRAAGERSDELEERYRDQKAHARQIVDVLGGDFDNARKVTDERALANEDHGVMERVSSNAFWDSFDEDPYGHLEFLENRVAPLASDADMLGLQYVGTDPAMFQRAFDRMTIVDGEAIPVGQRGFLLSKYVYEEQIKLKTARGLDKLKRAHDQKQRIASDLDLQRIVRENRGGVRELLLQLDATGTDQFRERLQSHLASREQDVSTLLSEFLTTTDENIDTRYRFFYAELAPLLELYRVRIGDTLTIKAFTRSGYVQSANLKVYGTFAFKGLEQSPQAGSLNLMDLVSFRELYGFMTTERAREIEQLRAASGAKEIARDDAEAELFGARPVDDAPTEPTEPAADTTAAAADRPAAPAPNSRTGRSSIADRYDPQQLEDGIVLNAAVLVKDDRRIEETIAAIEAAGKRAGQPIKAISWQKAAGIIGQFATLMRAVLFSAVLIIFVVALVVINNALVMATLERVGEIGTLRAIGAQRRFILSMLLLESVVVGILAGAFGAAIGAIVLIVLGQTGIPATSDVMTFFFSGRRLYPEVGAPQLTFALGLVLLVSVLSAVYPAWLAMRVSPREAMQGEE